MSKGFFRSYSMFGVDLEKLLHQVNSLVGDFQIDLMEIVAYRCLGILIDNLVDIVPKEGCASG
jgi:hypothetical protein